jgi:hypothetical protein
VTLQLVELTSTNLAVMPFELSSERSRCDSFSFPSPFLPPELSSVLLLFVSFNTFWLPSQYTALAFSCRVSQSLSLSL